MLELLYIARLDYLARDPGKLERDTLRSSEQMGDENLLLEFERASAARRVARKGNAREKGISQHSRP